MTIVLALPSNSVAELGSVDPESEPRKKAAPIGTRATALFERRAGK